MFYLINKEKGISSFKAINNFARDNKIKKIGHTGTLDPLATGLLLVATDDDTKLIKYIDMGSKTYVASMKLGYESDTLDIEGNVVKTNKAFIKNNVENIIKSYVKSYEQIPPAFSAKKVNGKRAYKLARNGVSITLDPILITVNSIRNIREIEDDLFQFEITVSRGTYIRSLIRDIGNDLGCGAIMTDLVRIKVAGLGLSDIGKEIDARDLINLKLIKINELKRLFDGKSLYVNAPDGKYAVELKNSIVGIIEIENNNVSNRKLFGNIYKRILNESS